MTNKILVWLEEEELLLLNGKVSNKDTQKKIDNIQNALNFGKDKAFIIEVIQEGIEKGRIRFKQERAVSCKICGVSSEISTYSSGKRKGQTKSGSKLISGVSFADDFIVMQGRPRLGICQECYNRIELELKRAISKERFEYGTLTDCNFIKDDERVCFSCSKLMFESEMGRTPTLMGQGTYPSTCPHCKAASHIFGPMHKNTNNWRIIEKE